MRSEVDCFFFFFFFFFLSQLSRDETKYIIKQLLTIEVLNIT